MNYDCERDRQYDLAIERMDAEEWERQNRPEGDQFPNISTRNLIEAHSHLVVAKENDIDNALEWIGEAIECFMGTPEADRLQSIWDGLDDIRRALVAEMNKIEEGWKQR